MTSPRWATIRLEGVSVCAVMMSMELESQTCSDETTLECVCSDDVNGTRVSDLL